MASPLVFPWLHVCVQPPEERLFTESDLMTVRLGSVFNVEGQARATARSVPRPRRRREDAVRTRCICLVVGPEWQIGINRAEMRRTISESEFERRG